MIGVTLVTWSRFLAAGIKSTFEDSVNSSFTADYALTSKTLHSSSIASRRRSTGFSRCRVVSGVRAGEAEEFRQKRISVTAVETRNLSSVIDLKWKEGSVRNTAAT